MSPRSLLPPGAWRADPDRSSVRFTIRHVGVAKTTGSLAVAEARFDDDVLAGEVDVASVDTGQPIRDARLRAEFFDVERFPHIAFAASSVREAPGGGWLVGGALTIRGVTREVSLRAACTPLADGAVRLQGRGQISRKAFGLDWDALVQAGRLLVGDRVTIEADVVAVAASALRAAA